MSNAACRELLMQILDRDDLDQGCLLMELAFIEFEENQIWNQIIELYSLALISFFEKAMLQEYFMKVHEVQLRETLNETNFG